MSYDFVIGKYTLESLTNGMYDSPLDLYREYIQNAVDSFDEAIKNDIASAEDLVVRIQIDSQEGTIVITDNGYGIPSNLAVETLLDIGNSHKVRSVSRGFRGIGRLAGLSYCQKLTFRTSFCGEGLVTIVEYNAELLRELLLSSSKEQSVSEVINTVVSVRSEKESKSKHYFEVHLSGVWTGAGLTDCSVVKDYLQQHAPLKYAKSFLWGQAVSEKFRLLGVRIPSYRITLNGEELYKPYQDSFVSDRVKKNEDSIQDIIVEPFFRKEVLCAVLWYAKSSYYGTVLDNSIKGVRVRQGNILVGGKTTCNSLFKEERFNGWLIGELFVFDDEIVANSRRDGFEKNSAFYELYENLKEWAISVSKEIRHLSYKRSLTASGRAVAEAEKIDDIDDENSLFVEMGSLAGDYCEGQSLSQSESDDLAESDFITKLSMLLDQKKAQTKYAALNINAKLTIEQRKVLERVFDLIIQEYDSKTADDFINLIAKRFC